MVKTPTAPQPPRTEPVVLAELTDVAALAPVSSDVREAERYARMDLSGQDLQFWSFTDCEFQQTGLHETRLRGSRLSEVIMSEIDAPVFSAPRTSWRNVEVTGSRLGSAELYASTWQSVTMTGSKINYLNARTADWQDVRFTDCALDELDLSDATVTRLVFTWVPDRHPESGRCPADRRRSPRRTTRDDDQRVGRARRGVDQRGPAGRAGSTAGGAPGHPGQRRLAPSPDDRDRSRHGNALQIVPESALVRKLPASRILYVTHQ